VLGEKSGINTNKYDAKVDFGEASRKTNAQEKRKPEG